MNHTDIQRLRNDDKFCDLTIIEQSAGGKKKHRVHKLIVCIKSDYYKKLVYSEMADKDTNIITVEHCDPEPVILDVIINAMYNNEYDAVVLYSEIVHQWSGNVDRVLQLYKSCEFLQLANHLEYISDAISKQIDCCDLIAWWSNANSKNILVPNVVEELVQKHIQENIKYFGPTGDTNISVNVLYNMWPKIDDPISEAMRNFLGGIVEAAEKLSKLGDNDPNEWWFDENEEETLPATNDHPALVLWDRDNQHWYSQEYNIIFQVIRKSFCVIGTIDDNQNIVPLSKDQIRLFKNKWKIEFTPSLDKF